MARRKKVVELPRFKVTGDCFLAGVTNGRIDRTVAAPTATAAAEQAFRGFHGAIYVEPHANGFTGMFGSRACGHVVVVEVAP